VTPPPDVLVVVPSSERTIPTLCAASFLRWAARQEAPRPRALALQGGAMKHELRRAGVKVVESPRQPLRSVERALTRVERQREAELVRKGLHRYLFGRPPSPDVVVAYTIRAGWPALRNSRPGTRVVTCCFEHGEALDDILGEAMLAELVAGVDGWIAADEHIAADLVRRGVDPCDVATIPPSIEPEPIPPARPEALRRAVGAADGDVVVGGFGLSRWHDGPDVFLRMASVLRRRHPDLPVRLVWVGAPEDGPTRWILEHDVRNAGLDDVAHLTGSLTDTDAWLGAVDVVAVTARVDPPPPVALQACVAAVPVVGFGSPALQRMAPDVGGEPAFTLLPHLDVVAMADAVATLAADEGLRSGARSQMREHLRSRQGVDDCARTLWEAITRVAAGGRVGDAR
jgi:glycosyltransferase involved in cell wall biosynthesis